MDKEPIFDQQGDIILLDVTNSFNEAKLAELREKGKLIKSGLIAEGEATGHRHVLSGPAELIEQKGVMFILVYDDGASVDHNDGHNPIPLEKDRVIKIGRVVEHDPFTLRNRIVAD